MPRSVRMDESLKTLYLPYDRLMFGELKKKTNKIMIKKMIVFL